MIGYGIMNTQDRSAEIDGSKEHNELKLQSPKPNIDVNKIVNLSKL